MPVRKIRTLHVEAAEDGTVGGSHRSLTDLVRGFPELGIDPMVLFYEDNPFADLLEKGGVGVIRWEPRAREREIRHTRRRPARLLDAGVAVLRRRRLLMELRPDIVHLNDSPFVGYDDWLPAARSLGIPCIASMRGDARRTPGPLESLAIRFYDRVIPVSRFVAASPLCRALPDGKVTVIHNGVDLERFARYAPDPRRRAEFRAGLGVGPGDFLVVMAGTVRRWKGQLRVVRAAALLPSALRERLRIVLAGGWGPEDEEYVEEVQQALKEEGLEDRISLLGRRSDMGDLFTAADLALHASIVGEPFGLVVVEALANGTPVLAAKGGGPAEILESGGGVVHDPADPSDMARRLEELMVSPALLRRMSAEARAVAHHFSIQQTRRKMVRLYQDLLRGRRVPFALAPGAPAFSGRPREAVEG
jgi:glycosyltransferase involved in cell wall biosynthesis